MKWYADRGFELDVEAADDEVAIRLAAVPVPADGTAELREGVDLDRLDILFKASVEIQGEPAQLQDARVQLVVDRGRDALELDAKCEDVETGDIIPVRLTVPIQLPGGAPERGGPRPVPTNEDDLDWEDETTLEQMVVNAPDPIAGPHPKALAEPGTRKDPATSATGGSGKGLQALIKALARLDDDDLDDLSDERPEPDADAAPAPKSRAKAAPKSAAKTSTKTSPKTSPKSPAKAAPKSAAKAAPKSAAKAAPKSSAKASTRPDKQAAKAAEAKASAGSASEAPVPASARAKAKASPAAAKASTRRPRSQPPAPAAAPITRRRGSPVAVALTNAEFEVDDADADVDADVDDDVASLVGLNGRSHEADDDDDDDDGPDQSLGAEGEARSLLELLVSGGNLELDAGVEVLVVGTAKILALPLPAESKALRLSAWLLEQDSVADLFIADDDLAEILERW